MSYNKIYLNLLCNPKAKQGFLVNHKTKTAYKPDVIQKFEDNIWSQIKAQIPEDHVPWTGCVRVTKLVYKFLMPLGYEKGTKHQKAMWKAMSEGKVVFYNQSPDLTDNLPKPLFDALKTIVFRDDRQVCDYRGKIRKIYAEIPGIEICLEEIDQITDEEV